MAETNVGRLEQPSVQPAAQGSVERQYVIFKVEQQRYALPLRYVLRALRMVAITPLPDAPENVIGVVDIAGQHLPVFSLRMILGTKDREPELSDRLLLMDSGGAGLLLMVDSVEGVVEPAEQAFKPPNKRVAKSRFLKATIQQPEGLVMVLEVDQIIKV
jgi:purine-binding chemotaxis protein CheW